MKDDYLSIEQVKELLPAQLKIIRKYGNSRSLYLTKDEIIISLSNSKEFESDKWWYSVFIYELAEKGVKEVCFVLGKKGIVVLPLTILLNYAEYADFNENYAQGKRFFIRIYFYADCILFPGTDLCRSLKINIHKSCISI